MEAKDDKCKQRQQLINCPDPSPDASWWWEYKNNQEDSVSVQ